MPPLIFVIEDGGIRTREGIGVNECVQWTHE